MKFLSCIEVNIRFTRKGEGWLKNRKIKKVDFVEKYESLCKKAFKHGTNHCDYRMSADGLRLVELARKKLDFKDTTYSGDIYFGLWKVYEDLKLTGNE